jgi:hypothetical protein
VQRSMLRGCTLASLAITYYKPISLLFYKKIGVFISNSIVLSILRCTSLRGERLVTMKVLCTWTGPFHLIVHSLSMLVCTLFRGERLVTMKLLCTWAGPFDSVWVVYRLSMSKFLMPMIMGSISDLPKSFSLGDWNCFLWPLCYGRWGECAKHPHIVRLISHFEVSLISMMFLSYQSS